VVAALAALLGFRESDQMISDYCLQCLTEKVAKALRDDTQIDDENRLLMEIVNHVGAIDEENACLVYEKLVETFGSVATAIEALKDGSARLYRE
jgi:hypothetical protein